MPKNNLVGLGVSHGSMAVMNPLFSSFVYLCSKFKVHAREINIRGKLLFWTMVVSHHVVVLL
jgi:hypothetical protein